MRLCTANWASLGDRILWETRARITQDGMYASFSVGVGVVASLRVLGITRSSDILPSSAKAACFWRSTSRAHVKLGESTTDFHRIQSICEIPHRPSASSITKSSPSGRRRSGMRVHMGSFVTLYANFANPCVRFSRGARVRREERRRVGMN
jgi:hypothetical protein